NTLTSDLTQQIRFNDTKTGRFWDVWPMEMSYSHDHQIVTVGKFIGGRPNLIGECDWILDLGIWEDGNCWLDNESWIDNCTSIFLNPAFSGNPVDDWTRVGGSQTGSDPAVFNVGAVLNLQQTITLADGDYTLEYGFSNQTSGFTLAVTQTVSVGSISVGALYTNATVDNFGSVSFTASGVTASVYELKFTPSLPGQAITIEYMNLCPT
ncbi:unnamed protein product, partial [marine sediment metagenome]